MAPGERNERRDNNHIYCFVPDANVDITVLAAYLKHFIDATATIRASKHPRDPERLGYTVGAGTTLGREALEDVISDTRSWLREQQTDEFDERPYGYQESDTWINRKDRGPTPSVKPPVIQSRQRTDRHTDPRQPVTFSTVSSVQSSNPSAIFSDRGSSLSDSSVTPADSASQVGYGGRASAPPKQPPRGGPNQPDPDSFRHLSISESYRPNPNQGARVQQQPTSNRHKDPKDDDKPYNRPGNTKTSGAGKRDPYGGDFP